MKALLQRSTSENADLNTGVLKLLEKKFVARKGSVKDLERLEQFLSVVGASGYILKSFREYGIEGYDEYVWEQNKPSEYRNRFVDGYLLGIIRGSIWVLQNFLLNHR